MFDKWNTTGEVWNVQHEEKSLNTQLGVEMRTKKNKISGLRLPEAALFIYPNKGVYLKDKIIFFSLFFSPMFRILLLKILTTEPNADESAAENTFPPCCWLKIKKQHIFQPQLDSRCTKTFSVWVMTDCYFKNIEHQQLFLLKTAWYDSWFASEQLCSQICQSFVFTLTKNAWIKFIKDGGALNRLPIFAQYPWQQASPAPLSKQEALQSAE